MSKEKPSAGAMRAAERIGIKLDRIKLKLEWEHDLNRTDTWAQIIDEETGLKELIEALEKTPSVDDIGEWEAWGNAPMILQQARNPGSVEEPPPNVKKVQEWIFAVRWGAHEKALAKAKG